MKPIPRLFNCLRCHKQTVICSHCDRGQVYCGKRCADFARRLSCRLAEKRYQTTLRGRLKHALRQQRYRARLKKKVTDQGTPKTIPHVLLNPIKNQVITLPGNGRLQCYFCKKSVSNWFRQGFLRHCVIKTVRAGP